MNIETLHKYYEDGWLIKQTHPTLPLTIWNYSVNRDYAIPARQLMDEKKIKEAEKILREGLKNHKDDPWLTYNLAKSSLLKEDYQRAKTLFIKAEKNFVLGWYKERAKKRVKQIEEIETGKRTLYCRNCNEVIPLEEETCPNCGSSYNN